MTADTAVGESVQPRTSNHVSPEVQVAEYRPPEGLESPEVDEVLQLP